MRMEILMMDQIIQHRWGYQQLVGPEEGIAHEMPECEGMKTEGNFDEDDPDLRCR